jgi:hypothetical protein
VQQQQGAASPGAAFVGLLSKVLSAAKGQQGKQGGCAACVGCRGFVGFVSVAAAMCKLKQHDTVICGPCDHAYIRLHVFKPAHNSAT